MLDRKNYFKDKKITVMGLGLLGRGIGVIKFLAEQGAVLTVTDLKTKEQLASSLQELKKLKKLKAITYHLGGHRLEDFSARGGSALGGKDLIIRAPNAPINSIYLAEARKNKITVEQDASLFCKLAPPGVKIIGITGTRGKSTVTHLLYEILKGHQGGVYLGGNIRGTATLPLLKKVKSGDVVVMELDSWQLQSFGDNKVSPSLAIFTSFMNDHQNYYRSTSLMAGMKRYFADKANIFKYQTKGDTLILGAQIKKKVKTTGQIITPKTKLPSGWKMILPGAHNEYNAMLAVVAARVLGVKDGVIKKVVEKFKGLPGRLEFIREVKGTRYYNDTTATTPDAVMAAVQALAKGQSLKSPRTDLGTGLKKIILIGGGADKELNFKRYGQIVPKYLKELILFKGTATDKILAVLPKKLKFSVVIIKSMKEAIIEANKLAKKGDLVLLSPGAASFGPPPGGFKNEFDRGDQFNNLVKKLK